MQKPIVPNKYLNKKWSQKENNTLANKLVVIKPMIDIKCPSSYCDYMLKTKKDTAQLTNRTNLLREYDIRKDNELLVSKISKIYTSSGRISILVYNKQRAIWLTQCLR